MTSFTKPDNNIAQLNLEGTERVAVFGAGAGGHSFAVLRAQKGNGVVTAIDVRSELLDRVQSDASKLHKNGLKTKVADYDRVGGTGLMGNSLDVVVVPNTLFMARDKEGVFEEAKRVLKPGGRVLVVDWKESYGGMGPQPEHVVNADMAKKLAEQVGLVLINEFNAGTHHYGLIYKKQPQAR